MRVFLSISVASTSGPGTNTCPLPPESAVNATQVPSWLMPWHVRRLTMATPVALVLTRVTAPVARFFRNRSSWKLPSPGARLLDALRISTCCPSALMAQTWPPMSPGLPAALAEARRTAPGLAVDAMVARLSASAGVATASTASELPPPQAASAAQASTVQALRGNGWSIMVVSRAWPGKTPAVITANAWRLVLTLT